MLYTERPDPSADDFYTHYGALSAAASDAERAALAPAYQAILGMVKSTNRLVKAAVAGVSQRGVGVCRAPVPARLPSAQWRQEWCRGDGGWGWGGDECGCLGEGLM